MMSTSTLQTLANKVLIAMKLPVVAGHQPQATQSSMQALQRVAGIEHLKRVLQRVATPTVHRRIDLDIPPGEHEQRGLELIDGGQQHTLDIQHGQCGQVEDALGHRREALVQVVRQIDGTYRKNGIAGEPYQQHPFLLWCHTRRCRGSGTLTTANPGMAQPFFTVST